MLIKNKTYKMQIEKLASEGQGIGRIDNFTVFVKGALPDDLIEVLITQVKKNYAIAKLIRIIEPSKKRVVPKCKIFNKCGGCQLQNLDYEYQLEYKKDKVQNDLKRIGKINLENITNIIGMENPYRYRNKAIFAVADGKIGFFEDKSHTIVEVKDCLIQNEQIKNILDILRKHINKNNFINSILIRIATKDIMICISGQQIKDLLIKDLTKIPNLKSLLINNNNNKIKVLFGEDFIYDYIGDIKFKISALSFFQVNTLQTYELYNAILKLANFNKEELVIDAYCGIGSIALFISSKVKSVIGIEISEQAIKDAKDNAKLNNINNVSFIVGDAKDEIIKLSNKNIDTIIVDPPRSGCDANLLNSILDIKPKKIIYVSCEPSTLARDLKILCTEHYIVKEVLPVDCFCQTYHIETVVLLELE